MYSMISTRRLVGLGFLLSMAVAGVRAEQTLTGSAAKGNLRVTVKNNGGVLVEQHNGSQFRDVIGTDSGAAPRKGSHLIASGSPCGLGGFLTVDQQFVSNVASGDTITTKLRCATTSLGWTQKVTYRNGTDYISYTWTITNETQDNNLTSLRFFHGDDVRFGNNGASGAPTTEQGAGFFDSKNFAVGGFQINGTEIQTMALRTAISPSGFTVASPGSVNAQVVNGALDNALLEGTDIGYALEWRMSFLEPGASWVIRAWERFGDGAFASPLTFTSPIVALTTPGSSVDLTFTTKNQGTTPLTLSSANATISAAGWTAAIVSPSLPVTLAAGGSAEFAVRVTSPGSTPLGTLATLSLVLTSGGTSFGDSAVIEVDEALPTMPTPTPTSTPTPSPSPTPTVTPTPGPVVPSILAPLRSSGSGQPVFSGKAFPGASVRVIVDTTTILTTTADGTGSWRVRSTVELALGRHTFSVETVDRLGRNVNLSEVREFIVTGGAALDFDGDGVTDLTRYSNFGSSITFRGRRSSDDKVFSVSLLGAVPAPGDYDGDSVTDFGSIGISGNNLIWRTRSLTSKTIKSEPFGVIGDQPLTGCSFVTPGKSSLAVVRGKHTIVAKEFDGGTIQTDSLTSGSIIGCLDLDGDELDDAVTVERLAGGDRVSLSVVSIRGAQLATETVQPFDRGYSIRPFRGGTPIFALVRTTGPAERTATLLTFDGSGSPISISLPRKIVLSSGVLLDANRSNASFLLYQDFRTRTISRVSPATPGKQDLLGKITKGTFLAAPYNLYETKRQGR